MCDVCFRFILSVRLAEQLKKLDRDRWTINFLRFSFEEFDLYHHAARPRTNRNGEKKNRATKLPNVFLTIANRLFLGRRYASSSEEGQIYDFTKGAS